MPKPLIIAITGPAGSGKSTVAAYLTGAYGAKRLRFADPLKAMTRAFLQTAGVAARDIERMIEGDLKEVAVGALGGRTPRHAMQTLGTEWGRDLMQPSLWVDLWASRAREAIAGGYHVVVEDMRFANEALTVKNAGGVIIALKGRGEFMGGHVSEAGAAAFAADYEVINSGTVDYLKGQIGRIFGYLIENGRPPLEESDNGLYLPLARAA